MKLKLKRSIAIAALIGAATTGAAHATEGWYGRVDAGYSVGGDLDVDTLDESFDLDKNWMASAGVGYGFNNGFRLEGELGYRDNDLDDDSPLLTEGQVQATSLMLNAYYDFNRGGRYQPYIGVGVGAAKIDAEFLGPNDQFDTDDTVTAYQAMAGVAIALSDRLDLDIGYRYFVAEGGEFDGLQDGVVPLTYEADYTHQAVTLGLRWEFGAPPPPPAPPPLPSPPPPPPPPPPVAAPVCPQSDFTVYFEWDRSNLNAAALETIDAAVNRARQCNVGAVVVVGHTDTSGSAQYNIGLSERRASVVRDALVSRGISASSIQTQARGETDLARATRDGVREPLNRRTAVTISFR